MKKIWIDGYEANVPQRLGSGQVAFNLICQIEKIDHNNNYTVLLPNKPMDDLPKERDGFKYKIIKPNKLWTRIALPLALLKSKEKPDLFFSPTHYLPRFFPVKKIMTVFDLSFLLFPKMFKKPDLWKLINWTEYSVSVADEIITISQNSKKDIIKEYKFNKDKITVALPGFDDQIFKPVHNQLKVNQLLEKYHLPEEYIIFIGTLQPRKNLLKLFQAVSRIEGLNLVVVGKYSGQGREAWLFEQILEAPKKLGIAERVFFTNFVPDEELPYLLSEAEVFVLPSLYEGFGIPVVEAMASGTPVIVSNVSSLPEVVGEAGILVNPESVDQLEQAIRLLTTDKKIRDKYAKKGLLRAKKFSWKKMAQEVVKTFERS